MQFLRLIPMIPLAVLVCSTPALAQTTAVFAPFGQGCGGVKTPTFSSSNRPIVGKEFTMEMRDVQPNKIGVLVVGFSNEKWISVPLPLDLGFHGMANCKLYVSVDVCFYCNTRAGTGVARFVLPNNAKLVGQTFYGQFFAPDPRANKIGVATTNAAKFVIGDR